MDVSQRVIQIRRTYGGSDRAYPSFNAPQYVRHGSVGDPFDLGVIPEGDLFLEGRLGGESGSQTLFFQFELEEPARLAGRIAPVQRYTDQYISFGLADAAGERISGNGEGYATVQFPFFATDPVQLVLGASSYVTNGYWVDGYAAGEGFSERAAQQSLRIEPRLVPAGPVLPAGLYQARVSSSQWVELPFRLQLSSRRPVRLTGDASTDLIVSARTSLVRLGGSVGLSLVPRARVSRVRELRTEATIPLTPVGTISRISPFGS